MHADEQRIHQHDDVASSAPQTQRQVYEWNRARLAGRTEPAVLRLLRVKVFHLRIWVAADRADLDDLAETLSRDLNKPLNQFTQAFPYSTDVSLAVDAASALARARQLPGPHPALIGEARRRIPATTSADC